MPSRYNKPDKIADLLGLATKGLNISQKLKDYQAVDKWPGIVGPAIAAHSQAIKIEGETLIVKVDHPVWLTELKMMEPQLIAELRNELPQSPIKKLKLVN